MSLLSPKSPHALLWMGTLPHLAPLFCMKAVNVTHSPNAAPRLTIWGARDHCVHESKIEAYCWEISEALSMAIPKGQRQALRDGRGLCCSFCRWKEIRSSSYDGLSGACAILTLHLRAWWEECQRIKVAFHKQPKKTHFLWSLLDRSCVFSFNLTMSCWPWDTSRWPEPRILSSSWPALSLDSKIWKKHKLETSLEKNVSWTWV